MTFVAQPYERFVEDLVLALTGGVTREEHQFTGTDATYSLATPGAYQASVRVSGQRGEAFSLFEQGVDFRFDSEQSTLQWLPDGRPPDPDSFFYVSYDLLETSRRLTDRNQGSVTSVLAGAIGRELAVIHKQMEQIYWSAFVETATGQSLQHVAALLGLSRKDARFASGEVLFTRDTPAPGDIALPAGTLVSTLEGVIFETTDVRTLRRGQLSVTVPVRAVAEGPTGRVEPRAIAQVNRPIFGIDHVVNEQPTAFSSEREDDPELRRRIRGTLERAGRSTVGAIRYALIEEIPEITETDVQVVEPPEAPGAVEVRLGIAAAATPELVARVEDTIFRARPAGVRVTHNLPTRTPSPGAHAAAEGLVHGATRATALPAAVLARQPAGGLALRAQVLLRPADSNLGVAQRERIADQVRTSLSGYVERVPMGAELIYARLLAIAVEPEEVVDAIVRVGSSDSGQRLAAVPAAAAAGLDAGELPAAVAQALAAAGVTLEGAFTSVQREGRGWELADAFGGEVVSAIPSGSEIVLARGFYRVNLATDARKPRLAPGDVAVALMDSAVALDVKVVLERAPAAGGDAVPPEVTPALTGRIADAVNRALIADPLRIRRAGVVDAVRAAIGDPALQTVAGGGVTLNAQFVETGRLLNATEQVDLEENHVPYLRGVDVSIAGALDG
jgi:uncharacterized phage protein gp47/JayE